MAYQETSVALVDTTNELRLLVMRDGSSRALLEFSYNLPASCVCICVNLSVCVCVCVRERERERGSECQFYNWGGTGLFRIRLYVQECQFYNWKGTGLFGIRQCV